MAFLQAHDLKDEFDQVTAEADTLKAELERKQTELEELTKQKEEIELALANSPMKQQASECRFIGILVVLFFLPSAIGGTVAGIT
jgi:chromosome segregation ATPase